jgi:hypothetical protein
MRKHQFGSGDTGNKGKAMAKACIGFFHRKDKAANGIGLASLGKSGGLCGIETPLSCLVSGPKLI